MLSASFDLRTATAQDVPALRENWRSSFGDTDAYLDFFFERRFVPDDTLVACLNGAVVSQCFLLPVRLRTRDGILDAYYLFAAATHPVYRGQGIMQQLLHYANIVCKESRKDAIVLLPGSPELYDYYARSGYRTVFSRRRMDLTREELSDLSVPIRETGDACSVVGRILSCRDGLFWDAQALQYALAEHRLFRGPYAASEHAFVSLDDDTAHCLCLPQHFGECVSLLLRLSGRTRFTVLAPPDIPYGTREDGGMICLLQGKDVQLRDAFISFAME